MSARVIPFRKPAEGPESEWNQKRRAFFHARDRALLCAGHVKGTMGFGAEFRYLRPEHLRELERPDIEALRGFAQEALTLAAWLIDEAIRRRQEGECPVAWSVQAEALFRMNALTLSMLEWSLPKQCEVIRPTQWQRKPKRDRKSRTPKAKSSFVETARDLEERFG